MKDALRRLAALTTLLPLVLVPLASTAAAPGSPVEVRLAVEGIRCGSCLARLRAEVDKVPGVAITRASITDLVLALDEERASAGAVASFVAATVARLEPGARTSAHLVLGVSSTACAGLPAMPESCFKDITAAIEAVPGVREVILDRTGKTVMVGFAADSRTTTGKIARALAGAPRAYTVDFARAALPTGP